MSRRVAHIDGTAIRSSRRLIVVAVVFVLVAGAMVARLVAVQILGPEAYREYGARNRTVLKELAATRGPIVDRNGIELAVSVEARTIWADPALVLDPADTARRLAAVLGVDQFALTDRLAAGGRFAYVARQVSDTQAEAVRELDLDGIFDSPEPRRYNPSGEDFAAALLGQAGIDNEGISGMEKQYADLLAGDPGRLLVESGSASHGRPTIVGGEYHLEPAVPGDGVTLTIDRGLQYEVETLVAEWVDKTGSEFGIAMIMDTDTGQLLTVANVAASETGPAAPVRENRAFTWLYEPGSIAKALTFAGLIEAGVVSPSSTLSVPATLDVYDAEFEDHPWHEEVTWTATEILARSSNVGTIKFADMGGNDLLYDTLVDFGVHESAGMGFPGESGGVLDPVERWSGVSRATISIGQGVSATPLRWLTAYNTIANGGVEVAPSLVLGVTDANGTFEAAPVEDGRRVVSEATAGSLTDMLESVVTGEGGTGELAAIPGYDIAGKTGTAEKFQPDGGYIGEDGFIHYVTSFAGFLPADDPQVTILVVMDNPAGDQAEASKSAAPLFGELALRAIRHQEIAQERGAQGGDGRVRAASVLEAAVDPTDDQPAE